MSLIEHLVVSFVFAKDFITTFASTESSTDLHSLHLEEKGQDLEDSHTGEPL